MFRTLLAVAASAVVLSASALPAAASPTVATAIDGFASSVKTVAYQQPVTFTGVLVKGGAAKDPVPNEPVQIKLEQPGMSTYEPVATGVTGSDGHFAITTTLPSGGYVKAAFAGDTGLAPGQSSPSFGIHLQAERLPTRFVLDPVAGSVPAGTPATFSGAMQVQVNGIWQPFEGAPLTLTMEPVTSARPSRTYSTTSGAGGRFSLTKPVSESSSWIVANLLNGNHWQDWYSTATGARYRYINAVSKTRVTGFSVPAKDEAHHAYYKGLYASGTVQRWNGTSWDGLPDGRVDYYYRLKGSKTWRRDNETQTDAYGHFREIGGVHLGTAEWQVRVRAADDTVPSTSTGTVTSTVTDQTHFASANANRGSSASSVTGQVTDWYNGQVSFSSLRGLKVRLYYRTRGSKTWHAYRTGKLGPNGRFYFDVPNNRSYYFKVVLPAQGGFRSCTSRTL